MTTPKPHIKLNTQRQTEGQFAFRYATRFPGITEEEEETVPRDYSRMAQQFQTSLIRLRRDRIVRIESRNPSLNISQHIDYIRIQFQSQFDSTKYFAQYFDIFGLEAVSFSKFATEGLFAVIDEHKVNLFLKSLNNFTLKTLENKENVEFDGKIKYIKNFELLSSPSIIRTGDSIDTLTFRLADFPLTSQVFSRIWPSLDAYLKKQNLFHVFIPDSHSLEVTGLTAEQLREIVDNFDIILSVVSNLSTVIGPSGVATPKRSYGFTVSHPDIELPIIGIIDTGISDRCPLVDIIIKDDSFNITSTGSFVDTENHGTGVAALAALGKRPYAQNYRGEIETDARLLSIKVMDSGSGHLKPSDVLTLMYKAKSKYPNIKIFVLTIAYQISKLNDEDFSLYAADLDRFSHANDCIIFICTANNDKAVDHNLEYNIDYFNNELTNLCVPAESMNNVTVGAASDNITGNNISAISYGSEYPTLYTRRHHINTRDFSPPIKSNKHYFKPDIIESGGDYEKFKYNIAADQLASIEVLSADPTESFFKHIGTSYSTPLAANLAAQIQKAYPQLRAQTLKALIINGADKGLIDFPLAHKHLLPRVVGNGIVVRNKSLYSNDNAVTFILEDTIEPESIKLFPIHLPAYLYDGTLSKSTGILNITATMCFSFIPYLPNQLSYCPVHIGFSIFKNVTSNAIMNQYNNSILRVAWTQDAWQIAKPLPYSNSQKISFLVGKNDLIRDNGTFKIAVNCRLNPQILTGQDSIYNVAHQFSLVLSIEENLKAAKATGRLYDEMIAINNIENIAVADIELEGTV